MAPAVLKKTLSTGTGSSLSTGTPAGTTASTPPRRPQAIHTVGELAAHAGLDREPVVRKWQHLIQAAVAEQDPDRYLQRWNQRRSISVLALMSLLCWSAIAAAAFDLI